MLIEVADSRPLDRSEAQPVQSMTRYGSRWWAPRRGRWSVFSDAVVEPRSTGEAV